MKNWCEEVLDVLEDIKEAFDIDRLLKEKFPVSYTFMDPECDPASVTEAKSYSDGMLDRLVTEIFLNQSRVCIFGRERVPARMPHHVMVELYF